MCSLEDIWRNLGSNYKNHTLIDHIGTKTASNLRTPSNLYFCHLSYRAPCLWPHFQNAQKWLSMVGCITSDLITKIDSRKNDAISTLRIHDTCHSTKSLFIVTKSILKMNRKDEEICWLVVSGVSDLSRLTLLCLSLSILRQNSMVGLRGWSQVPYFTADRRQKDWEEGASDRYTLLRPPKWPT